MEQSNKNITNANALARVRERNLAKENRETQANINDENMQDQDDQQPSEKNIDQPEDVSNAPIEKCLKKLGLSLRNTLTWSSDSKSSLYRPSGVYDDIQRVHISEKIVWGSMRCKWESTIVALIKPHRSGLKH
ncbi:hypothetical protein TNCV_4117151 [Trichonephila clavipes]|nr:hypothetical protein TNCV_4117151 [Trichonephila clavipes]